MLLFIYKRVYCNKYITEYKDFYKVMTNEPYDTYINLRERIKRRSNTFFP